jgi:hypothetical protein
MRLDMKARQSLVRATADRYHKANKKEKRKILKEFVQSTAWDENKPGSAETEPVSHGGGDERGEFCRTLCLTGVCSAWTEAVRNKAQV